MGCHPRSPVRTSGRGSRVLGRRAAALTVCCTVLTAACTLSYRGAPTAADPNRPEILRCAFGPGEAVSSSGATGLAGAHVLFMVSDAADSKVARGGLDLHAPEGQSSGFGLAPALIGATEIDASEVGAAVPGSAASVNPFAPGVGLYVFAEDAERPDDLTVVIRLGEEANRRDRQRFDGAHTTLLLESIGADRFGGTWTSADGARRASGLFCAVRARAG